MTRSTPGLGACREGACWRLPGSGGQGGARGVPGGRGGCAVPAPDPCAHVMCARGRGSCTDSSHLCWRRGAWVQVGDGASGWTLSPPLAPSCVVPGVWVGDGGRALRRRRERRGAVVGGRWGGGGVCTALGIALWAWVPADVLTAGKNRVWSAVGCHGGVGSAGAASKVPAGGRGQARPLGQLAELHILFTNRDQ